MTETTCKAKDPRTCRYHGTEIRMNEAAQKGDLETYFTERTALEKLKAEKFTEESEQSQDVIRIPFNLSFLPKIKGKKAKLHEELEKEKHQADFLPKTVQKDHGLTSSDTISVSPRKRYGYTNWTRTVYKKTSEGWEPLGTNFYSEYDLQRIKRSAPNLTNRQALITYLLNQIKSDRARRSLDS